MSPRRKYPRERKYIALQSHKIEVLRNLERCARISHNETLGQLFESLLKKAKEELVEKKEAKDQGMELTVDQEGGTTNKDKEPNQENANKGELGLDRENIDLRVRCQTSQTGTCPINHYQDPENRHRPPSDSPDKRKTAQGMRPIEKASRNIKQRPKLC